MKLTENEIVKLLKLHVLGLLGVTNQTEGKELKDLSSRMGSEEAADSAKAGLPDTDGIAEMDRFVQGIDIEAAKNAVWARYQRNQQKRRRSTFFRVAAAIGGVVLAGYLYTNYADRITGNSIGVQNTELNGVVLTTDEKGEAFGLDNIHQDKLATNNDSLHIVKTAGRIDYSANQNGLKKTHNLKVPLARTFQLVLADGTVAHLNAGTELTYPTSFRGDSIRKVFLKGEGYFEVKTDKTKPFIVQAGNELAVRVLGTSFNVSCFEEEKEVRTVLVEGKVGVHLDTENYADKAIYIEPGQMTRTDRNEGTTAIEEVDTDLYTSWVYGQLIFQETPFYVIKKRLERKFDLKIVNQVPRIEEFKYTGVFKDEDIKAILDVFALYSNFEYRLVDNQIIIEEPKNDPPMK